METSLHKQLKELFRLSESEVEYKLGRYRIDVVNEGRVVEIQQSGLSAIRDKINNLLKQGYLVEVVKPLVARKRIVKLDKKDGKVIHRRWSPKRATQLSLFDELIYFTRVFPHPNLKLVVPLVEIEETRYPGHGRRRRWRKNDFRVADRTLVEMISMQTYEGALDLHRLLPKNLPATFDTKELAEGLGVNRFDAQRIGYVLRKTGSALESGKRGNALLYKLADAEPKCKPVKTKLIDLSPETVTEVVKKPTQRKRKSAKAKLARNAASKALKTRKKTTTKKATTKKATTKKATTKKTTKKVAKKTALRTKARKKPKSRTKVA